VCSKAGAVALAGGVWRYLCLVYITAKPLEVWGCLFWSQ